MDAPPRPSPDATQSSAHRSITARRLGVAISFAAFATGCRDAPPPATVPNAIAVSALLFADETPTQFLLQPIVARGEALLPELAFGPGGPFTRAGPGDPEPCELRIVTVHQGRNGTRPVPADSLRGGAVSGAVIAIQVAAELECPRAEGPVIFRASAAAEHPLAMLEDAPSPGAATWLDAAERGLRDACSEVLTTLAGLVSTTGLDDTQILGLLTASPSPPPGPLAQAALEAGQRRLPEAALALRRLTSHPHRLVATRAAAALGALRDDNPETLSALVDLTRGDDPARHLAALHALADIGSPSALRYVEAIADSHPAAALREVARQRLSAARTRPTP